MAEGEGGGGGGGGSEERPRSAVLKMADSKIVGQASFWAHAHGAWVGGTWVPRRMMTPRPPSTSPPKRLRREDLKKELPQLAPPQTLINVTSASICTCFILS